MNRIHYETFNNEFQFSLNNSDFGEFKKIFMERLDIFPS